MTGAARWHEFAYEQTDIPAGMTLRDWHTQRTGKRATPRRWLRMFGALSGWRRRSAATERCRS